MLSIHISLRYYVARKTVKNKTSLEPSGLRYEARIVHLFEYPVFPQEKPSLDTVLRLIALGRSISLSYYVNNLARKIEKKTTSLEPSGSTCGFI